MQLMHSGPMAGAQGQGHDQDALQQADDSQLEERRHDSRIHHSKGGHIRHREQGSRHQHKPQHIISVMSILEILDEVPAVARCIALELKKISSPHEDAISTNEAYRRYGRGWIDKYTKLKQLNPWFRGSKKMYSVSEIERVKEKENAAARLALK